MQPFQSPLLNRRNYSILFAYMQTLNSKLKVTIHKSLLIIMPLGATLAISKGFDVSNALQLKTPRDTPNIMLGFAPYKRDTLVEQSSICATLQIVSMSRVKWKILSLMEGSKHDSYLRR